MLTELQCKNCGAGLSAPLAGESTTIDCQFCGAVFLWSSAAPPTGTGATADAVHRLIPLGAMLAGKVFVLDESTTVGTASGNGIRIEHHSLADRFASCAVRGDAVVLDAIGSGRSIAVNRRRIAGPTTLSPGDTVTIGDFDFRYERG